MQEASKPSSESLYLRLSWAEWPAKLTGRHRKNMNADRHDPCVGSNPTNSQAIDSSNVRCPYFLKLLQLSAHMES